MAKETDKLIETIEKSMVLQNLVDQVDSADLQSDVLVHHKDYDVTCLEKYKASPARHRFHFKTPDLCSYVSYCSDNADDMNVTTTFIDPDSMVANTIFDMGCEAKPMHREHTASLKLKKTTEFKEVSSEKDVFMGSQEQLIKWIEVWDRFLTFYDTDDSEMSKLEALRYARNLNIEKVKQTSSVVGDYSSSMSDMERIEAMSAGKMLKTVVFSCTPYTCLPAVQVRLDVALFTDGKPKMGLINHGIDLMNADISESFRDVLMEEFDRESINSKIYISYNG